MQLNSWPIVPDFSAWLVEFIIFQLPDGQPFTFSWQMKNGDTKHPWTGNILKVCH